MMRFVQESFNADVHSSWRHHGSPICKLMMHACRTEQSEPKNLSNSRVLPKLDDIDAEMWYAIVCTGGSQL